MKIGARMETSMRISERLSQIRPSLTLAINTRAREMAANGIPVTSLAVGEPDFPTPAFIREAAKMAIDDNFTRYTPVAGIPELRRAAGKYFEREYGVNVPGEAIIIGAGGKQCLYNFIQATINPGDEALIPSPYWVSYPDMVLLAEGVPVMVPADVETGFKLTPAMLAKKLTPKTRLLILNSPSNPTGAVYTETELAAIIEWALAQGVYVLSDEIYDQLVYPPARMASAIKWFERNPQMVGVVNGLSKSYAMTGWRVGFLAAAPELVVKLAILQGHSLSNVCSIAQKAALAALTGPGECVVQMRAAFERRRDLALDMIKGWSRATCARPDGAFYLFVDVHRYYNDKIRDSTELCAWLLENARVATVPGAAFGDDNHMRLSFAVADVTLRDALSRIGEALATL